MYKKQKYNPIKSHSYKEEGTDIKRNVNYL